MPDTQGTDPPYLRVTQEIRARIAAGELRPGDKAPSIRQISREWGVAKATAHKVLEALRQDGLVTTTPRVGAVVTEAAGDKHGNGAEPDPAGIAQAAMRIADRDGLANVSMRGVAHALGLPTMSLYRYVRSKDELVDLMADRAFGEIEYPASAPPDWRSWLTTAARLHWRLCRRHPWLPSVVSLTHPSLQPNLARYGVWTLRGLARLTADRQTAANVHFLVANYVRGTATNLDVQAEMNQRTGLTGGEWLAAQFPDTGVEADELGRLVDFDPASPGFVIDLDEHFEFGLQRLLDGIAALAD
ncbi:TetR family transcriptional regulator [Tamaricihabitans halophyticus]|uniref:TetR family transcriptional regulator n=1 Tax=Tamaricihabitans halophyticus TaxID=1262583 RepID=A0A4R2R0H4_9PSEU|nr:GntR family transcriptional regulator [Tamaricihabitans halophyticus]TCP54938.1 TetR family transcriptional regulator [Tamaricihabitans halophyticus]